MWCLRATAATDEVARSAARIVAYRVARRNAMDDFFGDGPMPGPDVATYALWTLTGEDEAEVGGDVACPACGSDDIDAVGFDDDPERHCNACGLDFERVPE
jgi:hypothetical protein